MKPVPGALQREGAPFETTHWTVVVLANNTDADEAAQKALERVAASRRGGAQQFVSFDLFLPEAEAAMNATAHLDEVSCYDLTWASSAKANHAR